MGLEQTENRIDSLDEVLDDQRTGEILDKMNERITNVLTPDEVYDLKQFLHNFRVNADYLRTHQYEISQSLTKEDWLQIISDIILKHQANVDEFMHDSVDPEVWRKMLY